MTMGGLFFLIWDAKRIHTSSLVYNIGRKLLYRAETDVINDRVAVAKIVHQLWAD